MQSYAHRQNLIRRITSPSILTSAKRANPPYALLRSLVTRSNHQSTLSRAHAVFDSIYSILTAISYSPLSAYTVTESPLEVRPGLAPTEATVTALFEHLHAHVTLNLTASCTLNMRIRTSLYPLTTSSFNLTLEPPDCVLQETCRAPGIVDQWHKACDYILFVISCALASSFTSPNPKIEDNSDTSAEDQTTPPSRWESTTRPHVIRLIPARPETDRQFKSKQASFSLSPISSRGAKNSHHDLKLRVDWECIGDTPEHLSTASYLESEDAQGFKPANGEGFYEWIISEGENKVVGRGASGAESAWEPDTPIKSLQEVMKLAGETYVS